MRKISQIPGQMSLDLFGVEAKEPEEKPEKKTRTAKRKVAEEKESQITPNPSPKEEEKPVRKKRATKKTEEEAKSKEKTVVRKKKITKKEEESPTPPKPTPSKTSGKANGKVKVNKGMYGNAMEIANKEGAVSIGKLVNRFRISATSAIAIFEKLKEEGVIGENGRAEKKGKGSWKI